MGPRLGKARGHEKLYRRFVFNNQSDRQVRIAREWMRKDHAVIYSTASMFEAKKIDLGRAHTSLKQTYLN